MNVFSPYTNVHLQTRKSLPVYPYREDLIQAIRDHQVLTATLGMSSIEYEATGTV